VVWDGLNKKPIPDWYSGVKAILSLRSPWIPLDERGKTDILIHVYTKYGRRILDIENTEALMANRRKEVRTVKLTVTVDEATWRALRNSAEQERTGRGRASVNALLQRLIAQFLARKGAA
jgi:hypothetical protein